MLTLHSHAETVKLFPSAVGEGIVEIKDVMNTRLIHFSGASIHGIHIITENAINIVMMIGGIQYHNGNLSGTVYYVLVFLFNFADEVGSYQDQTVNLLFEGDVTVTFTMNAFNSQFSMP